MAKTVYVIDGMGGGIGAQIVMRIRKEVKVECALLALATNAVAAQRMVDSGASRGASGENAFRVCLPEADFVLGPIGIVLPNSMMGELTPAMAEAVFVSRAKKILLPLAQSHLSIVGLADRNVGELIGEAVALLAAALEARP
jgi:Domain of unknown function (DUF3842)